MTSFIRSHCSLKLLFLIFAKYCCERVIAHDVIEIRRFIWESGESGDMYVTEQVVKSVNQIKQVKYLHGCTNVQRNMGS